MLELKLDQSLQIQVDWPYPYSMTKIRSPIIIWFYHPSNRRYFTSQSYPVYLFEFEE